MEGVKMAEEQEQTEVAEEVKTFTQADIDSAITNRLARERAKYETELQAERQAKADLELKLQETSEAGMTESEHREAIKKALEQTQAELAEFKSLHEREKAAKIEAKFDEADKQALLEAGANPKYASILLDQLKEKRGIESGTAFYKDSEGAAIEKSQLLESIKNTNTELFIIDRARGNTVPHGETPSAPKNETTEQYIARRNLERAESGAK